MQSRSVAPSAHRDLDRDLDRESDYLHGRLQVLPSAFREQNLPRLDQQHVVFQRHASLAAQLFGPTAKLLS